MTEQPPLPLPPPEAEAEKRNLPVALPKASPPWWLRLAGRLLAPWIEIKREPTVPPFVLDRPVCYVMEDYGLSNALILERACREAGLPSPFAPLPGDPLGRKRAYVALSRRGQSVAAQITRPPQKKKSYSQGLSRLLMAHRQLQDPGVPLVPGSLFLGPAPPRPPGLVVVAFPAD